jgi:hypothetical protein
MNSALFCPKTKKPESKQLIGLNSGLMCKRFSRIYQAPAS